MVKYNQTNNLNKEPSNDDSDDEDSENPNKIQPLKCFVRGCRVYFSDINNFRRHLIMHSKEENKEYVCNFQKCYSHFKCLKRLYKHFMEKHKNDLIKNEIKFLFDKKFFGIKDGGKKENIQIKNASNNNIKPIGENLLLGQKSSELPPCFPINDNQFYPVNYINNTNKIVPSFGSYNNSINLDNVNEKFFMTFPDTNKNLNFSNPVYYPQNQTLNYCLSNNYHLVNVNNEKRNNYIYSSRNLDYRPTNSIINNENYSKNLINNLIIMPPIITVPNVNNFNNSYYQSNVIKDIIQNKNNEQISNQFSSYNNFDNKILLGSIGNSQISPIENSKYMNL